MGLAYLNINLKFQLKAFNRPVLVQISRELYLSVSGRKDDLIQRILRHIETVIRNQDERAYDSFIKKCPIDMNGFEYERLVFEILQKCPCAKGLSCSVHGSNGSLPIQTQALTRPNDEPLFTQPVNPEEQVLKALALIKQYQHSPELLDRIHRSIAYWRSLISTGSDSKENTNHLNGNKVINDNQNLLKNPPTDTATPSSKTTTSSQGNPTTQTTNDPAASLLSPLNRNFKHTLENSSSQSSDSTPTKLQKSSNSPSISNSQSIQTQSTAASPSFIYPKHSDLVVLSMPIRQECFKNNAPYCGQLYNPNLFPQITSEHKFFIYRQIESSSVPHSKSAFLTCNGWSFHIGSTMIRVTSVLDTPIEITPYLKEAHEARINFRFIPSKEAMARVNGKEQSFFFQIVAAREDFNRWLNVIIPTSVFTYDSVYQKFISSFISSRPGCPDDELCMESREVSLRCPLTLCKLRNPVRGINCKHFQCFELESFLDVYLARSTRPCPVCSVDIPLNQLTVDRFVLELIRQVSPDCLSVIFDKSGKWTTTDAQQNAVVVDNYECTNNEIIDLT